MGRRSIKVLRRSHYMVKGVIKDNYPGLPEELKEFNYYYRDGETGHVIMAVPKCLLGKCEDLDMLECPFPVKYVIENGYEIYKNHVICEAVYDKDCGLTIPDEWYEV